MDLFRVTKIHAKAKNDMYAKDQYKKDIFKIIVQT